MQSPGGAEEDRTPDLCSAIAALSQLSYGPSGAACMGERAVLSRIGGWGGNSEGMPAFAVPPAAAPRMADAGTCTRIGAIWPVCAGLLAPDAELSSVGSATGASAAMGAALGAALGTAATYRLIELTGARRTRSSIRARSFWYSASWRPVRRRSRGTWICRGSTKRELTSTS